MSPTRGVLQEAWDLYKAHLVRFMTIAAAIWVFVSVLQAILLETGSFAAAILGVIVSMIGFFWLEAALIKAVQDVRDGNVDMSIGETFKAAAPFLLRITGAGLLVGIGVAIGMFLLIVPGLVLLTWWVLVPAVVVVENSSPVAALGRSKELVRGYGWEVFGIIVLTFVLQIVVGFLLGLVIAPLDDAVAALISNLVSGIVIGPFVVVTWTLLYFRMVGAKSGSAPATAPPPTV